MFKRILLLSTVLLQNIIVLSQISDRTVAFDDYYDNYIDSEFKTDILGWTGNENSCVAGTISATVKDKLLQRINYYRRMVGVEDQVIFSTILDAKCQEAALIMHANSSLSHDPPSNWLCHSSDGDEAAGASNLAYGPVDFFNPIDIYMEDLGPNNFSVGHRRWILNSKAKTFGVGQTSLANALWVIQATQHPSVYTDFIAYPPAGYIPNMLVPDRWSFGIPDADFSNATVIVKLENVTIPVSIISTTGNGIGDNTIVWEPSSINTTSTDDIFYTVDVNNVTLSNGSTQNYTYTTNIFNPRLNGDANMDGRLSLADVLFIAQFGVGLRTSGDCNYLDLSTEICVENGDLNNDNRVSIVDAVLLSNCNVGNSNIACPN